VFRVQKYASKINPGVWVERFPFPKQLGKIAWLLSTYEAAKKKYERLL
jgi:hypothetical protein